MLSAVKTGGSGERIVLLHGFAADSQSWLANVAELAVAGEVWTIDLPGHGQSPGTAPQTSLAGIAAQLKPSVLNQSNAPVHLIGHSLGGALALLLARDNPDRIASLTLIAPLGLGAVCVPEFVRRLPGLDDVQSIHEALLTLVVNPRLIRPQLASMVHTMLAQPGTREALKSIATSIENSSAALQAAIRSVVASGVERMVIHGLQDSVNPVEPDMVDRFGGRWHSLEACGHLPHVEQRQQVNRYLIEFIKDNPV